MSRRRVLLVSARASYRTWRYLQAAASLGLEVVLAAPGEHSVVPEARDGVRVDFAEPGASLERLLAAVRQRPVHGVVATDDICVELAALAARRLGLAHNPPEAARLSRRKDLARARLAAMGAPVPAFRVVDPGRPLRPQMDGLELPVVIKPLALAASQGVVRVDRYEQLDTTASRVAAIARQNASRPEEGARLLVEEYVPGVEVAVEGILREGRLTILAVFDKPDPLEGPFFAESLYVTPSRLGGRASMEIRRALEAAVTAYGLSRGPVHAELRLDERGAWVVEVAARTIGGECARLLETGAGKTLEELVLEEAVGLSPPVSPFRGAGGVAMLPVPTRGVLRRVEGVLEARGVPLVEDVTISVREGYELVPLPEGGQYLGFIFARDPGEGGDPAAVERALRAAWSRLRVVTAPSLPVTTAPGPAPAAGAQADARAAGMPANQAPGSFRGLQGEASGAPRRGR